MRSRRGVLYVDLIMKTSDFNYNLPEDRIAYHPVSDRSSSRLMVLNRSDDSLDHRNFFDVVDYFRSGDVLVFNDTKVIPARLQGHKETGGKVEIFLLYQKNDDTWEVLIKPSAKGKQGVEVFFGDDFKATAIDDPGKKTRTVRFDYDGDFWTTLDKYGKMPLPPYIKREAEFDDKTKYQTVFANKNGAVAAPTAGLHFNDALLDKIRAKDVKIVFVTLHVGYGTFSTVEVEKIIDHKMHTEHYEISDAAAGVINKAKTEGRRVIACGTTSVRTLESAVNVGGRVVAGSSNTNIFIHSPYKFKIVDAMITNFHLPESTLLMLVSAFAGYEKIMNAYKVAIEKDYRFFSYGDGMLVL